MTLDQQNLENGKHFPSTDKSQLVLSGNLKNFSNVAIKSIDTDVHSSVSHMNTRPNINCDLGQRKNVKNLYYSNSNGNATKNDLADRPNPAKEIKGLDSNVIDEAEVGLYSSDDSDKDVDEEYSDSDSDYGMIINAYSIAKNEEKSKSNLSSSLGLSVSEEIAEPKTQLCENMNITTQPKLDKHCPSELRPKSIQEICKPRPISNQISRRAVVRNDLHSAAKQNRLITSPQNLTSFRQQSPVTKRILEVSSSNSSDECEIRPRLKRKSKSEKIVAGSGEDTTDSIIKYFDRPNIKRQVNLYPETKLNNDIKRGLNPGATTAAILLSQSLGESQDRPNQYWENLSELPVIAPSLDLEANQEKSKLTVLLNEEGGYFQIGNETSNRPNQNYIFSVTINYATSLTKVIPKEITISRDKDFQFFYSLFGCSIYTDSFHDLDCPEISSEKASATVRSAAENLSEYFNQNSILPVYLVTGERKLALCEINLEKFVDVIKNKDIKLEGIFEIYEIGKVTSQSSSSFSQRDAKLAVSIQIEHEKPKLFIPKQLGCDKKKSKQAFIKKETTFRSTSDDSTDSSLPSDSKLKLKSYRPNSYKKRKYKMKAIRNDSNCCPQSSKMEDEANCLKLTDFKRYKARLMNNAENEVKIWKKQLKDVYQAKISMHEQSLQKYIAAECLGKINEVEIELSKRLNECENLQEKLTTALNDLSLKEEALLAREVEMAKSEKELNDRLQSFIKQDENSQSRDLASSIQDKLLELQNKNCKLQQNYIKAVTDNKELTLENIKFRRQLLESENLISVTLEKEALAAKNEKLLERKQYYKEQWLMALSDLHKLHSSNSKSVNNFLASATSHCNLNKEKQSPKLILENSSEFLPSSNSVINLLNLKEERKKLLNGGHVSSAHFIIKNIDRKIKELVMGTSQCQ